jgi:hypothetical protein
MTRISTGFLLIGALAALALSANEAAAGHAAGGSGIGSGSGSGKALSFQINKQTDTASPKLYNFHNGTHYDKHKDW